MRLVLNFKWQISHCIVDKLLAELQERKEKIRQMGGRESVERQRQRGKLTARERIEKLLDADLLSLLREGKKKEALDLVEDFLQQNYECPKAKG